MRTLLPASLTGRLVMTSVALVAVVSLLIGVVATIVMRSYLMNRLDDQLGQSLDRAQSAVRGDGGAGPSGQDGRTPDGSFGGDTPRIPFGQGAGSITTFFDAEGLRGVVITASGERKALSRTALQKMSAVEVNEDPRSIELPALGTYRVAATTTPTGGIVWQALPADEVDGTISSLIWWESLLALGGTVAAAGAGRVLVRRQLRPLRDVATTAHQVTAMPLASGEIGEIGRVPAHLTDPATEVGQVGEALNQMLGHVEEALDARHESEQQVRQFLADASHELRTPLSTIKGYAELSRRTGRDDPDQILAKVESEAGRMSSLVEDMLLLARLDAGREVDRRPVDLTRLVVEAVNDARVVDPERHWTFDVPDEPVTVIGDELRLHQAVTNLLTNASRHTPPQTTVDVRLRLGDDIQVEVHDDGPGIDPALVPTIFERFVRGDSSRTRASGGAGLGMSLVRAIMHAHQGSATVTSSPGDTTFTLTLPAS
ncbi:two-component sensor histidine kinase [Aeromicrobium sp. A1-2]|uniref:sensor histidine kinase n=1 Tax=Aeromicrobium sp. A1-2 TaxID=2107713 RepID=UPI000E4DF125|nr:HAMP domain-containing sensor histidine kinase [Aeromicrobium sp. A1-2]AXT85702.1 two-component sensor histidine kinase [Aeromicrobium sp. A1-2]